MILGKNGMKKIILAFLFWFIFFQSLFAGPMGFGVKGGLNIAGQDIANTSSENFSPVIGFMGGLFGELELNDFLYLQLETNYTEKGVQAFYKSYPEFNSQGNVILGFPPSTFTLTYKYLEIPFLVKSKILLAPLLKINLLAGPSMAFLL